MTQKRQVTPEGLKKLKDELDFLETTKRKEVAERLERAISHGDLSENADYEEAKDEQSHLEQRIAELKDRIANAEVVRKRNTGKVQLGSTVTLESEGDTVEYTLVSPEEADPSEQKISAESPIGEALIGAKEGDDVTIDLPAGSQTFTVKSTG